MKNVLKFVLSTVVILIILTGALFYSGVIGNLYNATIGRKHMDIQRENFEHNKSYVHGKIEDLAKYKREYQRATTIEEKAQIRNFVMDEFANFDKNYIDNSDLYNFLLEMERGE